MAAGGVVLTPDGEPVLLGPDTGARVRFVAASSDGAARDLLAALG
jgi:3'(2'), 5'-bisphosphate nucleotidase